MEETLVLIKPDCVEKMVVGEIISLFEEMCFEIVGMEARVFETSFYEKLYEEHKGKEFYEGNLEFMQSGTVVAIWLKGENVISLARQMIGATDPRKADRDTIRGVYGWSSELPRNCVHASDSPESADRELRIFFDDYGL